MKNATQQNHLDRYAKLCFELREQHRIASDIENHDSDTVIRARKEAGRIQHDIALLLESM